MKGGVKRSQWGWGWRLGGCSEQLPRGRGPAALSPVLCSSRCRRFAAVPAVWSGPALSGAVGAVSEGRGAGRGRGRGSRVAMGTVLRVRHAAAMVGLGGSSSLRSNPSPCPWA